MRIMNLPKLPAGLNSVDECVKTYLERLPAGEAPWPHVSTLLTAYMSWPNDQQRGNSFIATCLTRLGMSSEESAKDLLLDSRVNAALEMFGGMNALANVAFDQLSGEIGQVQRWWLWVADIFQLIVDMAMTSAQSSAAVAAFQKRSISVSANPTYQDIRSSEVHGVSFAM